MLNPFSILKLPRKLPEYGPLGLRQHFHAKGDGIADDWHSINDWLAAGQRTGQLIVEPGHYSTGAKFDDRGQRIRPGKAITVNLAGVREDGIIITGAGRRRSVFELAGVDNDIPFKIVCARDGADKCSDEYSAFDSEFSRFGIVARFDGPALQLGQDGCGSDQYPDALNSCYFEKLGADNSADSDDNIAVKVNYVLQSIIDIKANCHGRPDKNNKGVALQLRHSAFNTYFGSYCNADTCMEISGDDSSFANFFNPLDFEEATWAVRVTAKKSRNQVMMTPQLGTKNHFDCQSGESFIVIAPNDGMRREDFDLGGKHIGNSEGVFVLNDKGLEFVSLLNEQGYLIPSRSPRNARRSDVLRVVS